MHIKVWEKNKYYNLECEAGETVFNILLRNGFYSGGVCGGKGTCGKCKIYVITGDFDITKTDIMHLSSEEIADGLRLSCTAIVKEGIDYEITSSDLPKYTEERKDFPLIELDLLRCLTGKGKFKHSSVHIAIDIGTTTIASALLGYSVMAVSTSINSQSLYGADVISRIQSDPSVMQRLIIKDILSLISYLINETNTSKENIENVVISCNTVMGHLLLGYPTDSLGVYPFTPFSSESVLKNFKDIFKCNYLNCSVYIFPHLSAFIGGDVISGLYGLDFFEKTEVSLFVDLGTNAELAIGNKDKIIACSASAGPAFEGGNIKNGTGGIPGAICNVDISCSKDNYDIKIKTIENKPPIGICGTGIIETAAEMLRNNIMDETGLINKKFFPEFKLTDSISVYQKDIRELQSAKSAIRTGIEILMEEYGVTPDGISRLYLSGGFGHNFNPLKAAEIGLIPKSLANKVSCLGNTSLNGACMYSIKLKDNDILKTESYTRNIKELLLSTHSSFEKSFIRYMDF